MIYSLTLETALLFTGLMLVAVSGFALWKRPETQAWLRAFPRSQTAGFVLLVTAAIWSWILIKTIDLGEFSNWRTRILVFIPIATFLTWRYVDEFLAVRTLGMVTLLVAEVLLEAAWMRPEQSRLLLVLPVYLGIVSALFWIGMPYMLRDQIAWLTKNEGRWKSAAFAGIFYGVLLICLRLTLRHSA
jgi:hypothetical protein